MDFLQSSIWQFVSVVVSLLAVIITVILSATIYRRQTNKELSYEVITKVPILSVRKEVEDRIQVLFDNKSISNVQLVTLIVRNSGSIPITPNDYIEPIRFQFGEQAEILDAEVLGTTPNFIKVSIKSVSHSVEIEPILLNTKESILLKILVTHPKDNITLEARIVGLKRIIAVKQSLLELSPRLSFVLWLSGTVLLILVTFVLLAATYASFNQYRVNNSLLVSILAGAVVGGVIGVLGVITWVLLQKASR